MNRISDNQESTPLPVTRRERDSGTEPSGHQTRPAEPRAVMTSDQVTVYSSASAIRSPGKLAADMVRDFYRGRDLAWRLFVRNLRGMYRQTLLGLFWVFLPPILNTAFWVFLRNNTDVLKTEDLEISYTVFILTGMIFWQSFIDSFQMPLNMLNKNRNMISKLNFPRESLLLVGLGEILFDLAIRLLLLVPAFWYFEVPLHTSLALVPIALLGLILVGTGLGLLIMPFGSLYQDVGRFISVALPFWMILTPIIYPPIENSPLNWINPASPLLVVARDWALVGATSFVTSGLIYGAMAIPLFVAGLLVYRISIPVLIERMNA